MTFDDHASNKSTYSVTYVAIATETQNHNLGDTLHYSMEWCKETHKVIHGRSGYEAR